jgi:hypothetical protein
MTSHAFGVFIDVESSDNPVLPPKAVARTCSVQDPIELADITPKHNGPPAPENATPSAAQTPRTPSELEMSRPTTPRRDENEGVEALQSFSNPPMNKFRLLSCCLLNFGQGLNDSAPGALIPYIEKCVVP